MGLFSQKKTHSVALIDIGSGSVGGAFVHFQDQEQPVIYYTVRTPVELRDAEPVTTGMLRALADVERRLIEEGAPTLHRETGSGHVDAVLVSMSAPWQETEVMSKSISKEKPFVFTHALLEEAVSEFGRAKEGRIVSGRTVIATMLNGYETGNPFGKKTKRADLVLLASTLEKETARLVETSLRHAFHTHVVELTAFAPAAYSVFRDLYPHQKEFIVLDVSGSATDAAFVKRGLLAGVKTIPHGIHKLLEGVESTWSAPFEGHLIDPIRNSAFTKRSQEAEEVWLLGLREVFTGFAAEHALPRMLFLLADAYAQDFLKRILEDSALRSLWLSDEPLSIVAITPSHLAPFIKTRGTAEGDLFLAMLALFYRKRFERHGNDVSDPAV